MKLNKYIKIRHHGENIRINNLSNLKNIAADMTSQHKKSKIVLLRELGWL